MPIVKVEMNDCLNEIVQGCLYELKRAVLDIHKDNLDYDSWDRIYDDLTCGGTDHEIIEGFVPIYTKDIEDLFYLHGDALKYAYEIEGMGDGTEGGYKQVCIYCYIRQNVQEPLERWTENLLEELDEVRDNFDEDNEEEKDIDDIVEEFLNKVEI